MKTDLIKKQLFFKTLVSYIISHFAKDCIWEFLDVFLKLQVIKLNWKIT